MAILKITCPHCNKQMRRLDTPVCSGNERPCIKGEFWCKPCKYIIYVVRKEHKKTILVFRPSRDPRPKRFTDAQVVYMRSAYGAGVCSMRLLAKRMGVNYRAVYKAVNGFTYKHVQEISE